MGIKYKVNSDFFKTWSRNSAYILGYIFADGSLEDASYLRGKYLRISSCDLSILKSIQEALSSQHRIVKLKPSRPNGKDRYLLRIGDHSIYNDLIRLGVIPNKSLTMRFPEHIPSSLMSDFIRGYFDGDGTFFIEKRNKGVIPRLVFTSGSKYFLETLSKVIDKHCSLGKIKKVYDSNRSYQLIYKSREAMNILGFIFSNIRKGVISLDRKYSSYKKFKLVDEQRRRTQVA